MTKKSKSLHEITSLYFVFSGGGEGVEVVKNEPYDGVPLLNGKFTSGQYTYKIYHLQSKVSILIKNLSYPMDKLSKIRFNEPY